MTRQSNRPGAPPFDDDPLASLSGLLVAVGADRGPSTAPLFLDRPAINIGSYFFSDKIALAMSRAKPIEESENPRLYQIMRELAPARACRCRAST